MKKPHVHIVKKMKHKNDHQITGHKHINNRVHPVWVTSLGLGVKSGEVASLNVASDDDVHGMFFPLQG